MQICLSTIAFDARQLDELSYYNGVYVLRDKEPSKISIQLLSRNYQFEVNQTPSTIPQFNLLIKEEIFNNKKLAGAPLATYLYYGKAEMDNGLMKFTRSGYFIEGNTEIRGKLNKGFIRASLLSKFNVRLTFNNGYTPSLKRYNEEWIDSEQELSKALYKILKLLGNSTKYDKKGKLYLMDIQPFVSRRNYPPDRTNGFSFWIDISTYSHNSNDISAHYKFEDIKNGVIYDDYKSNRDEIISLINRLYSKLRNLSVWLEDVKYVNVYSANNRTLHFRIELAQNNPRVVIQEGFDDYLKQEREKYFAKIIAKEEKEQKKREGAIKEQAERSINASGELIEIDYTSPPPSGTVILGENRQLGSIILNLYYGRFSGIDRNYLEYIFPIIVYKASLKFGAGNPKITTYLNYNFKQIKNTQFYSITTQDEDVSIWMEKRLIPYFKEAISSEHMTVSSAMSTAEIDKFFNRYHYNSIVYKQFFENLYRYLSQKQAAQKLDDLSYYK